MFRSSRNMKNINRLIYNNRKENVMLPDFCGQQYYYANYSYKSHYNQPKTEQAFTITLNTLTTHHNQMKYETLTRKNKHTNRINQTHRKYVYIRLRICKRVLPKSNSVHIRNDGLPAFNDV